MLNVWIRVSLMRGSVMFHLIQRYNVATQLRPVTRISVLSHASTYLYP